ncbi:hypothetical protein FISHEDRAFT_58481 [Fistulina hepatica ATCC 64428]|uniref:HIG1 domain-containing protein n=1 Tax=Fistulina hepatica ATCC 64428 TaxID=1128425 RepID=A0A0D7AGW9_9AGAR|nr:hypothetical protein FISHEDRAFT_58481 [Fistulina hepatica ATCC 64428]
MQLRTLLGTFLLLVVTVSAVNTNVGMPQDSRARRRAIERREGNDDLQERGLWKTAGLFAAGGGLGYVAYKGIKKLKEHSAAKKAAKEAQNQNPSDQQQQNPPDQQQNGRRRRHEWLD